jgi:serine/threonine protein kinase
MIKGKTMGEGTYGKVYLATSAQDGDFVVKRNWVEPEVDFAANLREMDILRRLHGHPHIVSLKQVVYGNPFESGKLSPARRGYKDDSIHFILERADGDLGEMLYKNEVSVGVVGKLMVDILLGVEYIHSHGIMHRDLKPQNILVFQTADDIVAKICDFGLSKFYTAQEPQTPRMITAWYRAPEIALQDPHYTCQVDLWSVGCIFYELWTGKSLVESPDDDAQILATILRVLPKRLGKKDTADLKKRWGRSLALPRGKRKNFTRELFSTARLRTQFEERLGSIKLFVNLLECLLEFDPACRFSATQALNHPFFESYRDYIQQCRGQYPPVHYRTRLENLSITITCCEERKWAANLAFIFFNEHQSLPLRWYSHRILFQALDLFDRYLEFRSEKRLLLGQDTQVVRGDSEADLNRYRLKIEVYFLTCIYVAIKYFATLDTPISYIEISEEMFRLDDTKSLAQKFERELLQEILSYEIFRPTIYEISDYFGDRLSDMDIYHLLMYYGSYEGCQRQPLKDVYAHLMALDRQVL